MQSDKSTAASGITHAVDPHHWVEKHADYLYNFAMARLKEEEQSRDLVQETFLSALEKVDKFEGRSSERTWLTAILKNKIIDIYRKNSSGLGRKTVELDAENEQRDFFDTHTGHWTTEHSPKIFGIENQSSIINKEFNVFLQKCLDKLPALWLAVFTLKHMEDEPTEQICNELKVTPANFWVIIHRTKVNLRACLQKTWI